MFVDEAGLYLLPLLVRTYAPVGKYPTKWFWLTLYTVGKPL